MNEHVDHFKALGDVTRLKILMMLCDGEKCACDIQANFDLKQPTISHHMKILQQVGLVSCDKRGKWIFYSLKPEKFEQIKTFIDANLSAVSFDFKLAESDCEGKRID